MAAASTADATLRREQQRILRSSAAAFVVCSAVFAAAIIFLPRLVQLPGPDLGSRLTAWAGANLFLVAWVITGIGMVSTGRRRSADDIRGSAYSPPSPKIAVAAAFLQNTLEQAFVAVVAQFALVMLLPSVAMQLMAASVLLFSIGRITFLAGYPGGAGARAFGMALTTLPSLLAFALGLGALFYQLAR
jgi:hypothetical protein